MRKKIFLVCALCVLGSAGVFAAGKDKLGAYVGWPVGLSYSHEFSDLVELDLVVAYNGFFANSGGLKIDLGALFTMLDGEVDGNPWALTFGPAIGGSFGFIGGLYGSLDIMADLRWEIDIASVKGFNIFVDFAPGLGILFNQVLPVGFAARGGVGLRYRFP